ncbi:porphobilinogen deaminase, partial [Cryomyces antarcticus]
MPDPPTPLPPSSTTASTSPATDLPTINIGTRRSLLARIQTDIVEKALKEAHPERRYEIHAMSTMGDKNQ